MNNDILIIDDDSEYNFITEITFQDCGFDQSQLIFKLTAQEGLDYLDQHEEPSVIFLDINMPVMNGWDFLEEYEKKYGPKSNTKIIVTSSSVYKADKEKALTYDSVVDYVEKPISCEHISNILETS